jgi:CDP-diacylglycerol--serine O-phosphatidyltransferase
LPSPAAAALLAGLVWISFDNRIAGTGLLFDLIHMKWLAWSLTVFAGLSMVSDLKFYSGKDINLRRSVPFIVILMIVLVIVLISYSPPVILFIVSLVYALSGYAMWLKNRFLKGENSTLSS